MLSVRFFDQKIDQTTKIKKLLLHIARSISSIYTAFVIFTILMKIPKVLLGVVLVVLILTGGGYVVWKNATTPGKYDDFAKCLGQKGLSFYGAYWCPHCTAQKKLFGKSVKYLPYVECAIPGSSELAPACKEKNIKGFPTWTGPGDNITEGELTLDALAERSGCTLPK